MKVKSEREVAQSCPTLSDPTHCSLPDFSIYGIFQARVLEWGAIALSGEPGAEPNKRPALGGKWGGGDVRASPSGLTPPGGVATGPGILPHGAIHAGSMMEMWGEVFFLLPTGTPCSRGRLSA